MHPVLLQIGQFKIYSVGAFIALAAIASGLLYYYLAKKRGLKTNHIFDTVLYILVIGLVFGRLGYYFIYTEQIHAFREIFYFWQGGLLALPAILAGFGALLYILKRHEEPYQRSLDIVGLSFLLAWAIGKLGCHISGCSIGRPWTGFLSLDGVYPVDLLSSILILLIFIVLLFLYLTSRVKEGIIFFIAIEGYLISELLIKVLKSDFGNDLTRVESIIYLGLIIAVYIVFWLLHGPGIKLPWKKDQTNIGVRPPTNINSEL